MPKTKAFHRYFMAALCKISSETNCKAKFPRPFLLFMGNTFWQNVYFQLVFCVDFHEVFFHVLGPHRIGIELLFRGRCLLKIQWCLVIVEKSILKIIASNEGTLPTLYLLHPCLHTALCHSLHSIPDFTNFQCDAIYVTATKRKKKKSVILIKVSIILVY